MRLSRSFIPTMKETPAEAQIASHRLMLRAGLVRQTSAGIYAWLPLGYRVLRNPHSYTFGYVHGICCRGGTLEGGADPGRDGVALSA